MSCITDYKGQISGGKIRQRGFTLMELMITIAVMSILLTLALPNFRTALQNNRLTGQANEMLTAMQFARSEALKRGFPVEMCSSADGATCGGNWNLGWIVYVDLPGAAVEVLRVWPGAGTDFTYAPVDGLVRYQPTGFATAALTLDVTLPDCRGDNARQIVVELTGRAASERTTCP